MHYPNRVTTKVMRMCHYTYMESTTDIRYKNTRLLIDATCNGRSPIKDFATAVGISPSYASGIATPDPERRKRVIGESMARRIESAFSKPKYWLDTPQYQSDDERPEVQLVSEEGATFTAKPFDLVIQAIPLLTLDEVQAHQSGEPPANNVNIPVLPFLEMSKQSFAFKETTALMKPFGPGDLYYVDPDVESDTGDLVLCNLAGAGITGRLERGARGWRLVFDDKSEPPVAIEKDQIVGKVVARFQSEALRDMKL